LLIPNRFGFGNYAQGILSSAFAIGDYAKATAAAASQALQVPLDY